MYYGLNNDGHRINIIDALRGENYYCPICKSKLISKKGLIKQHHFAHVNSCNCDYWYSGMSEWHRVWQERLKKEYQEVIIKIGRELHIADVFIGNTIVEFQHSSITEYELVRRTRFYRLDNKNVKWVFDVRDSYKEEKIYWYKKSFNGEMYKWDYPKNTILGAHDRNSDIYLQVEDNLILEIIWISEDKYKEKESLKYFVANEISSNFFVDVIMSRTNMMYKPTKDYTSTFEYEGYIDHCDYIDIVYGKK